MWPFQPCKLVHGRQQRASELGCLEHSQEAQSSEHNAKAATMLDQLQVHLSWGAESVQRRCAMCGQSGPAACTLGLRCVRAL